MKKQKTAILQMFYGQNGNLDSIKPTPGESDIVAAVDEIHDLLYEKLKPHAELCELFIKYKDKVEDLHIFDIDKYYAEGFKFGLLIGVEAGESKFNN